MNAGGVPNTCKSSGKVPTGYLIEPGREISMKFRITPEERTIVKLFLRRKNDGYRSGKEVKHLHKLST
jgi:hypothetical protein